MNYFLKLKKRFREDYYYYYFFSKYENPIHYINMCEDRKHEDSNVAITGNNGFDFGISKREVIRRKGRPVSKKKSLVITNFSAILYPSSIRGYKTDMEFHFYNTKLFLIVYVFKNINTTESNQIINTIQKKYLQEETKDISCVKIVNADKNMLLVDNMFELRINYMSSDINMFNEISDFNQSVYKKSKTLENFKLVGLL